MTTRNIQFSELHNAFNAWFSTERTRFVYNIENGAYKGCVLLVTPSNDLDIEATLRHTTKNLDGTILARYEKKISSQEWLLEDTLDKHIIDEVISRLKGKSMDVPISYISSN